jgi:hypothetical protein
MIKFEDAPEYVKLDACIVADDKQKLEQYKIQRAGQIKFIDTITILQNDINILKEEMKILKSHLKL